MLLQRLDEYADRLDLPPAMYQKTLVQWLIDLDCLGGLKGFTPLAGEPGAGRRGKEILVPHVMRASGIKPKLLADNGEYVLRMVREGSSPQRVGKAHEQFVRLVRTCLQETGSPEVQAVLTFLENWDPGTVNPPGDLNPGDILTFRVDETLPVELKKVRKFWGRFSRQGPAGGPPGSMQCLVCGKNKPAVERQPIKIKGIPGGQPSGMAFISANKPAFESYGLHASLTGPTCMDCGERFGKALNSLIRGQDSHLYFGPVVYVFWTRRPGAFSPAAFLDRPQPGEVKELIDSARSGRDRTDLEHEAFYAAALSASGGRLVVRDWLETTVPAVKKNLVLWFRLQKLTDPWGEEAEPLGVYSLAAGLYRDNKEARKEMEADLPMFLTRAALSGGVLPERLLFQAVKRNRAEQGVTRPRMVLIKMILLSKEYRITEEDPMAELDLTNFSPAYLCGRLLAELEAVQRAAVPGIKATLIDRYFGTASSAPATVFGTLLRNLQSHLSKLRKEREGAFFGFQNRIGEIMEHLHSFPATLSLKDQAVFSLGYYHQRAYDRAEARKHKEQSRNQS